MFQQEGGSRVQAVLYRNTHPDIRLCRSHVMTSLLCLLQCIPQPQHALLQAVYLRCEMLLRLLRCSTPLPDLGGASASAVYQPEGCPKQYGSEALN